MTRRKEQVLIRLEGELKTRFDAIKESYGVEANAEVLRILIKEKYAKIVQDNNSNQTTPKQTPIA